MQNILQRLFTTSQFAKMHGINKRTLMYYDDIELFQPIHVGENGYRYYNFKQNIKFESILLLRKLRVPLKDIKEYLQNHSKDNLLELLYTQEKELAQQIDELMWLQDIVKNKIAGITGNKNIDFFKIALKEEEKQEIIMSDSLVNIPDDKFIDMISEFMQRCYNDKHYYGYPIGIMINAEKIFANEGECESKPVEGCFYRINKKYQKTNEVDYKPAGLYLVAYHTGDWKEIKNTYRKIIDYAKEHNLKLGKYFYEERLLDEVTHDKDDYFEIKISIPVEK